MNDKIFAYQEEVENALECFLSDDQDSPQQLIEAMRYSTLGGGKRLRAGFVYLVGLALRVPLHVLKYPAAAVEMIHAFSLIHDDLPAIDNDDLRRHKPTSHIAFGEALAILAGDSLHTKAFEVLSATPDLPANFVLKMIQVLAKSTGSTGIIGGEAYDVLEKDKLLTFDGLVQIHSLKTASLFQASLLLGALAAQCDDQTLLDHLSSFGHNLGIAFQIQDDVLEVESASHILGKSKTDARNATNTAVTVLGIEEAKRMRDSYFQSALESLRKTTLPADDLVILSSKLINRAA